MLSGKEILAIIVAVVGVAVTVIVGATVAHSGRLSELEREEHAERDRARKREGDN